MLKHNTWGMTSGRGEDFRHRAVCREEEDKELFFPIGTSGPALLQTEQAKAVCRRCPVVDECLKWALESGQDAGVWGGMSEGERRTLKRRERVLAEQFPPVAELERERPRRRLSTHCGAGHRLREPGKWPCQVCNNMAKARHRKLKHAAVTL